jgi:hypothetical protein
VSEQRHADAAPSALCWCSGPGIAWRVRLNGSLLDLAILYLVGVVGCAMRIYDVPLVPAAVLSVWSSGRCRADFGGRWQSAKATSRSS